MTSPKGRQLLVSGMCLRQHLQSREFQLLSCVWSSNSSKLVLSLQTPALAEARVFNHVSLSWLSAEIRRAEYSSTMNAQLLSTNFKKVIKRVQSELSFRAPATCKQPCRNLLGRLYWWWLTKHGTQFQGLTLQQNAPAFSCLMHKGPKAFWKVRAAAPTSSSLFAKQITPHNSTQLHRESQEKFTGQQRSRHQVSMGCPRTGPRASPAPPLT